MQIASLLGNGCHGDRCALRQTTLYCGWLLPMSIIILHNLVVFGLVLRVLCRKQPGGIQFTSTTCVGQTSNIPERSHFVLLGRIAVLRT